MIHPLDSVTLAYTKLRTRKIRTAFTILISGLLFGLLLAVLVITTGLLTSFEKLGQEGVGKKYIITASKSGMSTDSFDYRPLLEDPAAVTRTEQLHSERVAAKAAEARRLKLDYQPAEEDPSPVKFDKELEKKIINNDDSNAPAVQQMIKEYRSQHDDTTDIRETAKNLDVKQYLTEVVIKPTNGNLIPMPDGQEELITRRDPIPKQAHPYMSYEDFSSSFSSLAIEDQTLTDPYSTTSYNPHQATALPVVIPYTHAEKTLGFKKLPATASASERIERIRQVRDKAKNMTIDMCYRNEISTSQVNEALTTQKAIEKNKGNKDYSKPKLIRAVPDPASCTVAPIAEDTRTAIEKAHDANQEEFDKKFNGLVEPVAIKLRFQVIGLSPSYPSTDNVQSIVGGLSVMFAPGIISHWQIPAHYFVKLPPELRPTAIFGDEANKAQSISELPQTPESAIIEFARLDHAQQYLKRYEDFNSQIFAYPYANNTIIMQQLRDMLKSVVFWVTIIFAAIATIILASIIGRTIADGRRETAMFRAIGAKRIDIIAIYICYTLLLSLRIIIFVAVLGTTLALLAHYWLAPQITPEALITFSAQNLDQQISLIGFNSPYINYIPLVIIGTSLLAMIIPLLASVRRNPIHDMRQE